MSGARGAGIVGSARDARIDGGARGVGAVGGAWSAGARVVRPCTRGRCKFCNGPVMVCGSNGDDRTLICREPLGRRVCLVRVDLSSFFVIAVIPLGHNYHRSQVVQLFKEIFQYICMEGVYFKTCML